MPLKGRNVPIFNTSPMVGRLILACVIVHIVTVLLPLPVWYDLIDRFAFIAARYTVAGAWQFDPIAYAFAPITHLFLHGGFLHLLMNMAMLLAFGTAIERRVSALSFTLFYLLCGLSGAALWTVFHPETVNPLLGASGAISGMFGAVGRISLAGKPGHGMPFSNRQAALIFVLLWLVFNFVFGIIGLAVFGMEGDVAWEAHLGGFVAGFVMINLFLRRADADTPTPL
jgi:membrane associated rhomboid family serine protease